MSEMPAGYDAWKLASPYDEPGSIPVEHRTYTVEIVAREDESPDAEEIRLALKDFADDYSILTVTVTEQSAAPPVRP